MARKPKNYAQLTSEVEAAEAKLKSLKELQAQARKKEQSKLAEKIGKIVMKTYSNIDFLGLSDDEIVSVIKTGKVPTPVVTESKTETTATKLEVAPTEASTEA